jgi:hypothetical protein
MLIILYHIYLDYRNLLILRVYRTMNTDNNLSHTIVSKQSKYKQVRYKDHTVQDITSYPNFMRVKGILSITFSIWQQEISKFYTFTIS